MWWKEIESVSGLRTSRGEKMRAQQVFVQCIVIMKDMRTEHVGRADLNLLRTLFVLLEERHITRAASRCFLSQPAMSRALERLREAFGDELLIRVGRTYERTARGERVLQDLGNLLPQLDLLLRGEEFDPAHSEERFRLTMTDHASVVVLPELVRRVSSAAPHARLELMPWHDVFVCVVASRHPYKKTRFTLTEYLKYRHIVVDVLSGQQTPVDRPLAVLGLKRSVGLVLPYFLPACLAVAKSHMILTTPARLARELEKRAPVRVIKAPREITGFKYEMTWHARLTADAAHAWFRDQVRAVARALR